MKEQRPVNLDLTTIKFPITAIVSILHRISGVILFLFIPLMLWGLQQVLGSGDDFAVLQRCFAGPVSRFILWGILSALIYHIVAGIRHLLMDFGLGEGKVSGRLGARIALGVAIVLIVLLGIALW
ncbi:MAG: succinate dehydrogenase, cytochrome b556 subunit [Legionellales bacterium]|nr:succinate dehydrogenase, cytochrome b556 subunit [Legionellales bacterium]